jgi:hypothetical protein
MSAVVLEDEIGGWPGFVGAIKDIRDSDLGRWGEVREGLCVGDIGLSGYEYGYEYEE